MEPDRNARREAEAGLFAAYQRLDDLQTSMLEPDVLVAQLGEAKRSIATSEAEVIHLGGNPADVQAAGERVANDLRRTRWFSKPGFLG